MACQTKETIMFDDAAVNNLRKNKSKKISGVRNLARKMRKAVGREMKYVAGKSFDVTAYPNSHQPCREFDQILDSNKTDCPTTVISPKELYEKRQRNIRTAAQLKSNKTLKQTKRSAKMELRRVFGSNRDTAITPLILEAETQSATGQALNKDSKESRIVAKSKLKRAKELARLSSKELKYLRDASRDSRITQL